MSADAALGKTGGDLSGEVSARQLSGAVGRPRVVVVNRPRAKQMVVAFVQQRCSASGSGKWRKQGQGTQHHVVVQIKATLQRGQFSASA